MGIMNEATSGIPPRTRAVLAVLAVILLAFTTFVVVKSVTSEPSGLNTTAEASPHAMNPSSTSSTPPSTSESSSDQDISPAQSTTHPTSVDPRKESDPASVRPLVPVPDAGAGSADIPPSPTPDSPSGNTDHTPVAAHVAHPIPIAPPLIPTPAAVMNLPGHNPNVGPAPGETGIFRMTGPAPVERADYGPMAYVLPLNPPGPQNSMVRWVRGMGVSPTSADRGTVYVLGHAWAQQWLVFNGFSELATRSVNLSAPPQMVPAYGGGTVRRWATPVLNGSLITLSDSMGRQRQWVVDNTWLVPKSDAINDIELNSTDIPGRIILIACAVGGGRDLDYNVIVSGHLV